MITLAEGNAAASPGDRDQAWKKEPPQNWFGFAGAFSFDGGVIQTTIENWCQKHLADEQLPLLLEKIDKDFAEAARSRGCLYCGVGRLHVANIKRKPRGLPEGTAWDKRLSFCCDQDGCRCRATPPSVRFLGRKVYAGFIVVLLAAMCHGLSANRVRHLRKITGADARTLKRWRDF